MLKLFRNISLVILGLIAVTWLLQGVKINKDVKEVPISEITNLITQEKVEELNVDNQTITAKVKDEPSKLKASYQGNSDITEFLKNNGIDGEKIRKVKITYVTPGPVETFFSVVIPYVLPAILLIVVLWFFMRQVQGANNKAITFGQSSAKMASENSVNVKFSDVAGAKEAKEELQEIVEFLKTPQKFLKLGAKIPKGVLLLGSPGVGKTLLARAVAGEANAPFFHISGSEFVEMFVGVGASRVRDLFNRAKKNAPCLIFIDEIDAVGRQRGAGLGGGHDEREQTLNQILVEMDGFENETNVIVIAATNRPDVLDPALLRPGRFDRQITIDLPDIKDREEILKIHAKNKPLEKDVELKKIAERTPGFSGADLMNLLNEAAILAGRNNQDTITAADIKESVEKVILGPQRKSHILTDEEKRITAYHEGGHALVGSVLPHSDPVHKVTILSRGRAGGYTLKLPVEDKHYNTRSGFLDEIAALMGGYAAEKLVFNELTTGPSNDLKVATNIARKFVTTYGMSEEIGPVVLGEQHEMVFLGRDIAEQKNYSEEVAKKIDHEVAALMKEGWKRATDILTTYRSHLDTIAERLIKEESLEQEEFHNIVKDIIPAGKKTSVALTPMTSAT